MQLINRAGMHYLEPLLCYGLKDSLKNLASIHTSCIYSMVNNLMRQPYVSRPARRNSRASSRGVARSGLQLCSNVRSGLRYDLRREWIPVPRRNSWLKRLIWSEEDDSLLFLVEPRGHARPIVGISCVMSTLAADSLQCCK